jgi:alpha-glucosidase
MEYTDEAPIDPLTFEVFPSGISAREYYEDDGLSFDYQRAVSLREHVTAEAAGSITVQLSARQGSYMPPARAGVPGPQSAKRAAQGRD